MLKLQKIPEELQNKLVDEYIEVKKRYFLRDWGPGELKAGRFAEVVLRIFQYLINEPVTPFDNDIPPSEKTKILNKVENSTNIDIHIRQKVSKLTRILLDFRNNRDSAHLCGFNANHMDAFFTVASVNWIISELIRIFGCYSMNQAEKIVEEINIKEFPAIFYIEGEQFISIPNLKSDQEILLLLSHNLDGFEYNFLFEKTKDKNTVRFKNRLKIMIKNKLIAKKNQKYYILPEGIKLIESIINKNKKF